MESLDNRFTSQVDFNVNKSRIAAIMMRMRLSIIYLVGKTDWKLGCGRKKEDGEGQHFALQQTIDDHWQQTNA